MSGLPLLVPAYELTCQWHLEVGLTAHRIWGIKADFDRCVYVPH